MADIDATPAPAPEQMPPAEEVAAPIPEPILMAKPGSIKRKVRRPAHAIPGQTPGTWNKFCQEPPAPKAAVQVSAAAPAESAKKNGWLAERQAQYERRLAVQQRRADAEAAERRQLHESRAAEHRQRVQQRVAAHAARLQVAAEEREAREAAYQDLLARTRERGLLFEKLAVEGDEKVKQGVREKDAEYRAALGKVKQVPSGAIASGGELHPTLKLVQRQQMTQNKRREEEKAPVAFTALGLGDHPLDSGSPSSRMTKPLPGSGLGASLSSSGHSSLGRSPKAPGGAASITGGAVGAGGAARTAPRAASARRKPAVTHRASSPVAIPGVQILVDGKECVPDDAAALPSAGTQLKEQEAAANALADSKAEMAAEGALGDEQSPSTQGPWAAQGASVPQASGEEEGAPDNAETEQMEDVEGDAGADTADAEATDEAVAPAPEAAG